nr:hypothetical protein [Tanacetum cinerariifolium]
PGTAAPDRRASGTVERQQQSDSRGRGRHWRRRSVAPHPRQFQPMATSDDHSKNGGIQSFASSSGAGARHRLAAFEQ